MSDMTSLNGASVRDESGRAGRIVTVSETTIKVAWMQKGLIAEEATFERTALAAGLQVLTLKEGWKPLFAVAGVLLPKVLSPTAQLSEELHQLFEPKKKLKLKTEAIKKKKVLYGKKTHSPFKRFSLLGPGPDQSFGTREVSKRTRWDCTKTGKYQQRCVLLKKDAKGRLRRSNIKKNIRIKPGYKASYNQAYKAWRKGG